jgi:hypothetical protein
MLENWKWKKGLKKLMDELKSSEMVGLEDCDNNVRQEKADNQKKDDCSTKKKNKNARKTPSSI